MLAFREIGVWGLGKVKASWVPSTRRIDPEIERLVDRAWGGAMARPGVHLFDGAMCRMESGRRVGDELHLSLSKTGYKTFLGTNLAHSELYATHADCFANATGVSTALVSTDDYLLLGRRNAKVAYYPDRIHPFAGALEARDPLDLFDEVYRELNEELDFSRTDIRSVRCIGIAEDVSIHQPETIFAVEADLTRDEIRRQVDDAEHCGSWSTRVTKVDIETALGGVGGVEAFTPIARAVMLLLGRERFGEAWFEAASIPFRGKTHKNVE